jgi:hypothetical protein
MIAPVEQQFPKEVFTDPKELEIHPTRNLMLAFPRIYRVFDDMDEAFMSDREGYLQTMEDSVFEHPRQSRMGAFGGRVACSLLGAEHAGDEIMVTFAPFSDGAPKSSSKQILELSETEKPGMREQTAASPSSWNQITKSATYAEFLKAGGRPMPVLTIFSPVPTSSYFRDERSMFRQGDFTPAGELVMEALEAAQERLHGSTSETQISKVHVHGLSLGASNAVGTAYHLSAADRYETPTVTTQELIIGPKNIVPDLAKKFTVGGMTGEAAERSPRVLLPKIEEPKLRAALMRHDSDKVGMIGGMVRGMAKLTYLQGLTHPDRSPVPDQINTLIERGVSVLAAFAVNSAISKDTQSYLPDEVHRVQVKPVKGEKTGHLINEHVGLSGLLAAIHIVNASQR